MPGPCTSLLPYEDAQKYIGRKADKNREDIQRHAENLFFISSWGQSHPGAARRTVQIERAAMVVVSDIVRNGIREKAAALFLAVSLSLGTAGCGKANNPAETQSPGRIQDPDGTQDTGGIQNPGGIQDSGGIQNPGGIQDSGGMQEPGGTRDSGGMQEPGGTQDSGGIQNPGGTQDSGGIQNPGGTQDSGSGGTGRNRKSFRSRRFCGSRRDTSENGRECPGEAAQEAAQPVCTSGTGWIRPI